MDEEKGGAARAGAESAESADAPSPSISTAPSGPGRGRPANYRILVGVIWFAVQAALILTADRRAENAFGFRMFSESSAIKLVLYREIDGAAGRRTRVHVDDGVWTARAADGTNHRLTWYDRVPTPYWPFDRELHASYGARAQLSRLAAAVDDVAAHLSPADDLETRRLILDVTVRRNGREPVVHELTSRERRLPSPSLVRGP